MHVFYSFGATMSRQPSSLQLPHGQPLQPRGVVYQRCPVHSTLGDNISQRQPISLTPQQRFELMNQRCPVHSNFSSLGDDISQRQPISLTPQQRFELEFMGPRVNYIIAPQTDRPVLQPHSHLEFYHSSGTSHRNPILDCSIQYTTHLSTPISPRPSPSLIPSANLGATANIPVIKNIETKPHEELVISIADCTNTDIPTDPQTSISMPIPIFPEPSVKETEDIELTDDPYSSPSVGNPILDCSIHLSTPISPRPSPSLIPSANLGATANIPVIKNIETKPHEELVISIADCTNTEPPDSSTLLSDQPYVPPSVQILNPPCSQRIAPYFIPHYQIRNQFRPLSQCYSSHRDFPSPPLSQIFQGCKHPPPHCWYEQSTNTDIPTDPQTSISMPIPIFPEPSVKETEDIELTDDPYSSPSVFQNLNLLLPKSYAKPPYSFSALIAMAISSSPRRMSTTSDIYNYISTTFPFYDRSKRAWKNAVRNCLFRNECFRKAPFAPKEEKSAQCNYWIIDPLLRKTFMKGSFQTPKTSQVKRPKRHETKLKSSTVGVSLDSILLTYATEFGIRTIPNSSTNIKELVPSVNKETSVICLMQRPPSPT